MVPTPSPAWGDAGFTVIEEIFKALPQETAMAGAFCATAAPIKPAITTAAYIVGGGKMVLQLRNQNDKIEWDEKNCAAAGARRGRHSRRPPQRAA